MNPIIVLAAVAGFVGIAMLVAQLAGRALGRRRIAAQGSQAIAGVQAIGAAMFALLGLLIAFTFSGASARFEARRALVIEQINTLGTVWMRLDLLPLRDQEPARALFRRYVDGLYEAAVTFTDEKAFTHVLAELTRVQDQLWKLCTLSAVSAGNPYVPTLVLTPLNQAFDLSSSRLLATRTHVQPTIVFFLIILSLLAALIVGHSQAVTRRPDYLHMAIFSVTVAMTIYVILDFEFPSIGLLKLDSGAHYVAEFRATLDRP